MWTIQLESSFSAPSKNSQEQYKLDLSFTNEPYMSTSSLINTLAFAMVDFIVPGKQIGGLQEPMLNDFK